MGNANLCYCGHLKCDHFSKTTNYTITRTHCEWDKCKCKKFKLKEIKPSNYKNNRALNEPETRKKLSEAFLGPPLPKKRKYKKKEIFLKDVNSEGILITLRYEKKSKYNNGEYF